MGSNPDPGGVIDQPPASFDEFQRQASLMTSCTLLWKELTDHFTSLENDIQKKSEAIKRKIGNLDAQTKDSLDFLEKRETTIDGSISMLLEKMKGRTEAAITALGTKCEEYDGIDGGGVGGEVDDGEGLLLNMSSYCSRMNSKGFWGFVTLRKKEMESVRAQMPAALADCVDPARFVLEAISEVFPVDKRKDRTERVNDLGWACVLILESLIPVVVDPILGKSRLLVTPIMKERAKDIAETWKLSLDERGGIENVKTPDVHTFLQHLVTFGIFKKEDLDLYRKLVIGSAWRKQMPKLAVSLGLGDKMPEMIEELIGRGQQVDAVHFSYEVGLVDKFPPVPLLKAFLKDAKKTAGSVLEDLNNSGRSSSSSSSQAGAAKKEQSALRAVIKCIEEYKLEAEFPPEHLKKRLEQLEKAVKTERKRPAAVPANKRTRASNGGPMPPAKAGRSTNAYVSSFPTTAVPAFMKSPSPTTHYGGGGAYPVSPVMYGNRSPQSSSPYSAYSSPQSSSPYSAYSSPQNSSPYSAYSSPEAGVPHLIGSYPVAPPPMNYSPYGGGYGNGMPLQYQPAYYR